MNLINLIISAVLWVVVFMFSFYAAGYAAAGLWQPAIAVFALAVLTNFMRIRITKSPI